MSDYGGPDKYLLASTGPNSEIGINGAIMGRDQTKQPVINTISVDSWDEGAEAVKAAAGRAVVAPEPRAQQSVQLGVSTRSRATARGTAGRNLSW